MHGRQVTVQRQTFQRFVGENTPASGVIQIDVPAPPISGQPIYMAALVAVVGGALLLGLARAFSRPPPRLGGKGRQSPRWQ